MSGLLVFTALAAFVGFVAVTTTFNYAYAPYLRHWERRADLRAQAIIFQNDPASACVEEGAKMRLRLKTKAFDRCEETAKVARSSPSFDAFVDLVEELQFCKGGQCILFSTNIFGFLGWIFWGLVGGLTLSTLVIAGLVGSCLYNRWQTNTYSMPLYGDPSLLGKQRPLGVPWQYKQD